MSSFAFYAVVDHTGGISTLKHDKYEGVKAVFNSKEAAQKVLDNNPDNEHLLIIKVSISSTGRAAIMKTQISFLNRAFRTCTKHWLRHPEGFKSKREWRQWCRAHAVDLHEIRRMDGFDESEAIHDQYDADCVVAEELSNY